MSRSLTARSRERLYDALLRSFPRRANLERLALLGLDLRLGDIVSDLAPQADCVLALVSWAETNGRVPDLVDEARRRNAAFEFTPDDDSPRPAREEEPRRPTMTTTAARARVVAGALLLAVALSLVATTSSSRVDVPTSVVLFEDPRGPSAIERSMLQRLLSHDAVRATRLRFEWLDQRRSGLDALCKPQEPLDLAICVSNMPRYRQHVAVLLTADALQGSAFVLYTSPSVARAAVISTHGWGSTYALPSVYEYLLNRLLLTVLAIQVEASDGWRPEHSPGGYGQAYYDKVSRPSDVESIICSGHFSDSDASAIAAAIGQQALERFEHALSLQWLAGVPAAQRPAQGFRCSNPAAS
jgi:hypothetical protein